MPEKDLETDKLELSLFRRKSKKDKKGSRGDDQASSQEVDAPAEEPAAADPPLPADEAATTEVPATTDERPAAPAAPASSGAEDTQVIPSSTSTAQTGTRTEEPPRRARGSRVAPKQPRRRPQVQLPSLSAQLAVLVVGAVVGVAAVALTFASLQLCELVTGTDSCGGPGLLVLLAVVILMILGGSAALTMFDVPDAGGLSFLGVAMFVAICLVVLLPSLLEPWMVVVAPVLCALSFAVAHWIVTRFDEDILEDEGGPPPHDVR